MKCFDCKNFELEESNDDYIFLCHNGHADRIEDWDTEACDEFEEAEK